MFNLHPLPRKSRMSRPFRTEEKHKMGSTCVFRVSVMTWPDLDLSFSSSCSKLAAQEHLDITGAER